MTICFAWDIDDENQKIRLAYDILQQSININYDQ